MRKILMCCGLALVLASSLLAGPAQAATVSTAACGQPILSNTTGILAGDLHCSLAMAAGATLDLNGHSLIGSGLGSGDAITYLETPGATSTPNITLENGTVTNWSGVFGVIDGPGTALRRMMITHVKSAFSGFHAIVDAEYTMFSNNGAVVEGGIVGVRLNHSALIDNTVGVSGSFAGYVTVANSLFMGNGTAIACTLQQTTISHTAFIRNVVAMNLRGCPGASVTDSTFRNNRSGLVSVLYSPCGPCSTPAAQQAISDQILRNRFQGNGVAVNALHSATLVLNAFSRNARALTSVALTDGTVAPTIAATSNTFHRNGTGIYVTSPARLKSNTATDNRTYGIYAPAAVDLGGNVAYGNGTAPQCTGVICATD